jgi:hypothetical protein
MNLPHNLFERMSCRRRSQLLRTLIVMIAVCSVGWCETSKFDPALLDSRYPDMSEWAKAGVSGGVPTDLPVVAQAKPGDNLQALIDATATTPTAGTAIALARVIQLAPGEYPLNATLQLRSGVVLRGSPTGTSKLHIKLRGTFTEDRERGPDGFSTWTTGILGRDVHHAGLEDLTVSYDDSLPPPPTLLTAPAAFINNPNGVADLWVVAVRFTLARDCWLLRCKILNSGTHPVMIEASAHVTVAETEIAGAHNKGSGAGYFNITRSAYTLVDGVNVHDIRHLVIQDTDDKFPCHFNVIIRASLAVDVNFLNGDAGHNLIENCHIVIPSWHWWPPIGAGLQGKQLPPGPGNLVYRCAATRAYPAADRNFSMADDPERVYALLDHFSNKAPIVRPIGDAPRANTLYPVR